MFNCKTYFVLILHNISASRQALVKLKEGGREGAREGGREGGREI